ncbi:hypothetical protein MASR2M78_17840 [Treponema sp.]
MKDPKIAALMLLTASSVLYSCATFPLLPPSTQAWPSESFSKRLAPSEKSLKSVALSEPIVERQTQGYSIKAEISRMAPLLFLDKGIRLLPPEADGEYQIDIYASEREYEVGLTMRHSTLVDICLRRRDGTTFLLASRSQSSGSLASSSELYRLLESAIGKLALGIQRSEDLHL